MPAWRNAVKPIYTLALLSLLLSACTEKTAMESAEQPPRPVHLLEVSGHQQGQLRRFPAIVEATQTAELAFRVGGELQQLPLRPGQNVTQGQLVAALDPTDFELSVEQAAAQTELVRGQFARSQRMLEQALISQAEFDQTQADLRVAEANLRGTQTNLEYTRLKAPFSGVIAHLHVENYENIAPQQPIMTLQVDGYIDVSIQVPERLFARVRRDLDYQPDVIFDGAPNQTFSASIREWDRSADAATNTYRVVFTLPAPEQVNILPGMTATVLIDAARMTERVSEVLVVPSGAVFAPEHKPLQPGFAYVWVYLPDAEDATQGRVTLRQVQIANMTNHGVEIIGGLEVGERIVQAGVHHLHQDQRVKPWIRERGL
ncbi:MAG: efflux RND transporter periplasmic adaptor subunit [Idiomarina sp.]|nr:efflux RND transporter periplasmic adaptor subunit [Idiomarina sp.]